MKYQIVLALMTAMAVDHVLAAEYKFFDSDVYKQSVAFDAPIIDPFETRELLLELNQILPENEAHIEYQIDKMSDEETERFEAIDAFESDLRWLIRLTYSTNEENCRDAQFSQMNSPNRRTNSLSSPAGNKPYGPNIQTYIKHYKLAAIEYCESLLKKGVSDTPSLNYLTSFIKTLVPDGVNSIEDYSTSLKTSNLTEKMREFLNSRDKKEFREKFESMKNCCQKVSGQAEFRGFVLESLKDQQVASEVMANKELINLGMINEACSKIQQEIDRSIAKSGFRGKIRSLIH